MRANFKILCFLLCSPLISIAAETDYDFNEIDTNLDEAIAHEDEQEKPHGANPDISVVLNGGYNSSSIAPQN